MHERIAELIIALKRKGIKQYDFAKKLGVTETAVSAWKNGRRNITEQTIKSICREFSVDYMWLTTGKGEMFVDLPDTLIDEICSEYDLDDDDRKIIEEYIKLDKNTRNAIKQYIKNVFKN